MKRERQLWLTKGIAGLLFVGFGLSLFGEAVIRKAKGDRWFAIGTGSLAAFNFGLCLMFDSHNHQRRLETRQARTKSSDTDSETSPL